jgi:hypothetical protein
MFTRNLQVLVCSVALLGIGVAGCDGDDGSTELVSVGSVSSDLSVESLLYGGDFVTPVAIKGAYGHRCKVNGGRQWELTLNDPDDRSLEVALNDTFANCPLTIQEIEMQWFHSFFDVTVSPPIVLGLDFAEEPSAVNYDNGRLVFYANATLNALEEPRYTNDFSIHLIYSDDAEVCKQKAPPATYSKVSAAAEGSAIAPPDYGMEFAALELKVDAQWIVQDTSTGDIILRAQEQGAEEWKIFDEVAGCCGWYQFADIDSLYKSGEEVAGDGMGVGDLVLPWNTFALLGERLPETRVLVLKHTGEGGVYSYELFQVMFPGPHPTHQ